MKKYSSFNSHQAKNISLSNVYYKKTKTTKNQQLTLKQCKNLLWNCSLTPWQAELCKGIVRTVNDCRLVSTKQLKHLDDVMAAHKDHYRDDCGDDD